MFDFTQALVGAPFAPTKFLTEGSLCCVAGKSQAADCDVGKPFVWNFAPAVDGII